MRNNLKCESSTVFIDHLIYEQISKDLKGSQMSKKRRIIMSAYILFALFTWTNLFSEVTNEYVFPDVRVLAKMLNVSVSEYHNDVKKEIIFEHKNQVNKTGASNPDIGYEK